MENAGEEPAPLLPVQELAAGRHGAGDDGGVPSRYVARRAHDGSEETPTAAVPVIDLGRLCQPAADGESASEAAKLRAALQSWGLFLVANHGIEVSLMDAVTEASREFFRQPLVEKQRYTNMVGGNFQLEGYGNDRVATEEQVLDWSDRHYLKVEPQDERNLALWPPCLRDVLHEFTTKCTTLKDCLLPEMAKLLELDGNYFSNQFSGKAETYARFNYYPPCPRPELVFGLKPHTDASFITLVMVDSNIGGLQVLRDGEWYNVPNKPDTLLINLGDQMEIMSNGIFKSPVHRVVPDAEKERLSVVMFYSLDPEREIQPAGKLIDENHPALYKKVKIKEYIAGLFEYFAQGKLVIETAKI
ncbi:hypothetical protein HU200_015389 [Digitaria exilis]|uniref:Fe2OG dioxygenase domain-containing protein n=1 Tax=Digitaria exilis TaxID=1010633 RepID=A0A835KJN0_9POAL|nr:hypothetical protein HU200_015389 [Digitaria exilis]